MLSVYRLYLQHRLLGYWEVIKDTIVVDLMLIHFAVRLKTGP